ncbi:MAG: hypothetical protein AB2556_23220 [Candidatus Thiodiazotropha sp.]
MADPKKVWIIDDYIQWSNLAYLAISRVEYLSQLEQVVCPLEEGSEGVTPLQSNMQSNNQLRKAIEKKLTGDRTKPRDSGLT